LDEIHTQNWVRAVDRFLTTLAWDVGLHSRRDLVRYVIDNGLFPAREGHLNWSVQHYARAGSYRCCNPTVSPPHCVAGLLASHTLVQLLLRVAPVRRVLYRCMFAPLSFLAGGAVPQPWLPYNNKLIGYPTTSPDGPVMMYRAEGMDLKEAFYVCQSQVFTVQELCNPLTVTARPDFASLL
jgi:hypothetical protein